MDSMLSPVTVLTVNNRGFSPEELAARCTKRIVSVSDNAPPAIRDQARAFQGSVQHVIELYMKEAVRNDRVSVYNMLERAGLREAAKLVRDHVEDV